jgi:hypothetical protein
MPETFDPYRKWLGIPADEQPPHYYRLLAIQLYESDPDVISNAADGRMSQIKNFQTGPYGKVSQQILNQISAAKICLLDPQKKTAYDRQLQQRLASTSPQSGGAQPIRKQEAAEIGGDAFNFTGAAGYTSRSTSVKKKSKSKPRVWPIYAAVGGGLLAAASAVFFVLHGNSTADDVRPAENPPGYPRAGGGSLVAKTDAKPPLSSGQTKVGPAVAVPKNTPPVSTPAIHKPKLELAPDAGDEPKLASQGTEPLIADETPPQTQPGKSAEPPAQPEIGNGKSDEPKRLPVPEESLQQAAKEKVHDIFQQEISAAKTIETHAALAKKLLEQAGNSKDEAAAYYVLLTMAGQQAIAAGEVSLAMDVVDKIYEHYQIDAGSKKAEVLAAMVKSSSVETAAALFDAAMKLCDEAMTHDDFALAERFDKTAAAAGRKTRDPDQNRLAQARQKEIEQKKTRFAVVQKALDTLASEAAGHHVLMVDEANLVAGQWYCFTKGDWGKGLPMLAKGSRDDLAGLARQDLAATRARVPGDAKQQIALADAWWSLGEKEPAADKAALLGRARHWYGQAADKTVGLDKARIQKRLEEAAPVSSAPLRKAGRDLVADVTDLPFAGKTVCQGKQSDLVIDTLNIGNGCTLPAQSIPGATVKHFFFMQSTAEIEINLESRQKRGQIPRRFKAYLYLSPPSRKQGSDGIVWTVEAGPKGHLKLLLTTPQPQDMNVVDLPLPPGTTRIVVKSLPGAANSETNDWGIMANPVVVFGK